MKTKSFLISVILVMTFVLCAFANANAAADVGVGLQVYKYGQHIYQPPNEPCLSAKNAEYIRDVLVKVEKNDGVEVLVFAWDARGRDIVVVKQIEKIFYEKCLPPVTDTKMLVFLFAFNTRQENGTINPCSMDLHFNRRNLIFDVVAFHKEFVKMIGALPTHITTDQYVMATINAWYHVFKQTPTLSGHQLVSQ